MGKKLRLDKDRFESIVVVYVSVIAAAVTHDGGKVQKIQKTRVSGRSWPSVCCGRARDVVAAVSFIFRLFPTFPNERSRVFYHLSMIPSGHTEWPIRNGCFSINRCDLRAIEKKLISSTSVTSSPSPLVVYSYATGMVNLRRARKK